MDRRRTPAWIALALFCAVASAEASPTTQASGNAITVQYSEGDSEIAQLQEKKQFFLHRPPHVIEQMPAELIGLNFPRRNGSSKASVKIHVPAGETLYLLVDSDDGVNAKLTNVGEMNRQLKESGWTRLADAVLMPRRPNPAAVAIYRQTFTNEQTLSYLATGFTGVIPAAAHLSLGNVKDPDKLPANASHESPAAAPGSEYAVIARRQTSIKALFIREIEAGMVGHTMDYILTATPGIPKGPHTDVLFTTPVGKEMHVVLDEAIRAVCIQYPHWKASKVELSFGDKYTPKDGGSIGAATGTLFLSMLRGFEIDPNLAMTGDITVDNKIRRIGGVVAKIRGATDSQCDIIALPTENYEQVADGMVYEGLPFLSGVQVIGVSTLEEAVALARVDRDPKLAEAITTFSQVQEALKKSPNALYAKENQDRLAQVLQFIPNHFSAKLLLLAAQHKQPTHLSITASIYYTDLAANQVLPMILRHAKDRHVVTPSSVEDTLRKLSRVRLIAASEVYPYIDAIQRWIQTAVGIEAGRQSPKTYDAASDAVINAANKLNTDRDVREKLLHEGI